MRIIYKSNLLDKNYNTFITTTEDSQLHRQIVHNGTNLRITSFGVRNIHRIHKTFIKLRLNERPKWEKCITSTLHNRQNTEVGVVSLRYISGMFKGPYIYMELHNSIYYLRVIELNTFLVEFIIIKDSEEIATGKLPKGSADDFYVDIENIEYTIGIDVMIMYMQLMYLNKKIFRG